MSTVDDEITLQTERAMDEVLADSFPASDPPPWTLGVAAAEERHAVPSFRRNGVESRAVKGQLRRGLGSIAGMIAVAWFFPVAILLIGVPIALAIRLVGKGLAWIITIAG
jgi:hypothetical protein